MMHRRVIFTLQRWLAACIVSAASGLALAVNPSLLLDLTLEPETRQLEAVAVVQPLHSDFRFALHESLDIRSVEAAGKPLKFVSMGRGSGFQQWRIQVPDANNTVRITYGGQLKPLQKDRDHRSVLRTMPPMASIEGSFLPSASGWYPQVSPMFNYRVNLNLPADQRALVAGRLLEENLPESKQGRYRASFEFAQFDGWH